VIFELFKVSHIRCVFIYLSFIILSVVSLPPPNLLFQAIIVKEIANGQIKTCVPEEKGLDLVRRDWCQLSKEVGRKVLSFILSGQDHEAIVDKICEFLSAQVEFPSVLEFPALIELLQQ
jgi:hypothetical protein